MKILISYFIVFFLMIGISPSGVCGELIFSYGYINSVNEGAKFPKHDPVLLLFDDGAYFFSNRTINMISTQGGTRDIPSFELHAGLLSKQEMCVVLSKLQIEVPKVQIVASLEATKKIEKGPHLYERNEYCYLRSFEFAGKEPMELNAADLLYFGRRIPELRFLPEVLNFFYRLKKKKAHFPPIADTISCIEYKIIEGPFPESKRLKKKWRRFVESVAGGRWKRLTNKADFVVFLEMISYSTGFKHKGSTFSIDFVIEEKSLEATSN